MSPEQRSWTDALHEARATGGQLHIQTHRRGEQLAWVRHSGHAIDVCVRFSWARWRPQPVSSSGAHKSASNRAWAAVTRG